MLVDDVKLMRCPTPSDCLRFPTESSCLCARVASVDVYCFLLVCVCCGRCGGVGVDQLTCVTEQYIGFQISRASARYFCFMKPFHNVATRAPARPPASRRQLLSFIYFHPAFSQGPRLFFFDRKLTVRRLNGVTEQKVSRAELIKGNKEAKKAKRKRVPRRRKRIINKPLGERMEEYGAEGRII